MVRFRTLLLATSALVSLGLAPAAANPLGAQVVGGSATVQGQGTSSVTVTQTTNSAIINWNTFNIGAGDKTNIVMPSSASVQLDRVIGGLGASEILGSLTSNGRVFLVNPDGFLFGAGSTVTTSGFVATTHDIANADFMAGKYNFSLSGNPSASIVNLGTITASNTGFAALVAPGVRNSGTITANLGTVTLASGNGFTLDFYGDKLITLNVNDSIGATVKDVATGQTLNALVQNDGKLKADGGRVELSAVAARQVVDSVINNTGVIEANTVGTKNGMIVLSAATAASLPAGAPAQTVKVSGKLSTAGKTAGAKGGTIQVTGKNIALNGAALDASGAAGGGTVLIGGDTGGGKLNPAVASNPAAQLQSYAVATASTTTVDAATTIDASARDSGNGGKVVVWSDQATAFYGSIMARGGASAGNGGFVETSGHTLDFAGARVDTSAGNGKSGSWLLDPYDLTIDSTAASTISTSLATTDVFIETTATGTSGPGIPYSSGNGDIFVNSGISWSSSHGLTLSAYRDIGVNANIVNTGGAAAVILRADNTGNGTGTVSFDGGGVSTAGSVSIFYNPSVNPAGSVVNPTSYVSPTENFTGNVTGGGTLTAYMLVNTVNDLQNIENNLSGVYALGRDVDASATTGWNAGAGFVPIGNSTTSFTGTLNGDGNTISNLVVNLPDNPAGNNAGLFGVSSGVIQDIGLVGGSVTGFKFVGGLVGHNYGTVSQSYATGAVHGGSDSSNGGYVGGLVGLNDGSVTQSHATGAVSDGGSFSGIEGGLVGDNNGSVTLSYATGTVSGGTTVGGLVGFNGGTVSQSYATGAVSGNGAVGGLVGSNNGTSGSISVSYATGAVTGGSGQGTGGLVGYNGIGNTVSQSYATGTVNGLVQVGGLVGENYGTVSQSYATGAVGGSGADYVGGLVGFNGSGGGVVSQSYATGTVTGAVSVGGLVGENDGAVSQSYAVGATGGSGSSNVGGLVGYNIGSISQTYATGAVAGNASSTGGLVGYNDAGGNVSSSYWDTTTSGQATGFGTNTGAFSATGLTTAQAFSQSSYSGFNFSTDWFMIDGQTRPFLRSEYSTTITNSHQLQLMTLNATANYTLANNIDLGPDLTNPSSMWASTGFVPVGDFSGMFNGQGAAIIGLKIHPTANTIGQIGLFQTINATGVVENLTLSNVDINANPGLGSGFQQVGALAGTNSGLIDNVTVSGTINGGTVSGMFAGGIVGLNGAYNQNTGTIQNSSSSVVVTLGNGVACTLVGNSCNDGRTNIAGGLVGVNSTNIVNSSASGNVIVGSNSQAGGLAGVNQVQSGATIFTTPTISQSVASGNVSSTAVNVALGGLVGYNAGGALITLSRATGNVSATADLSANINCSGTNCLYSNAGGLVGQNQGTIQGAASVPLLAQTCVAGQTCATGAISGGSGGQAGGLVGFNDGIITNAFARDGSVTGAAGYNQNGGGTSLGGFAASNQGLITGSHATGNVGTPGVANLFLGGLVADNGGTISNSFATGNVNAGDTSQAGGLTGSTGPWRDVCSGCQGDGSAYFNTAMISNSQAYGNVSVGTQSLAGGLSGGLNGSVISNTITPATITGSGASGTVSAGGNSIVGGLVSIADAYSTITNSTTASTSTVTATGTNSWVGGFVGANAGTINLSSAAGAVNGSGLSDSLVGGFAGLNLGIITDSTTAATSSVTATGANNYVGGFVGANFGAIDPSTSAGAVTGGANNFVGGFAGTNGALLVTPPLTIPGSTFPVGTISNDSVGTGATSGGVGSTVNPQIGTSSPSTLPASPSVVQGCNEGPLCALLQAGLTPVPPPASPESPVDPLPQPVTQIVPPNTDVVTTPPVVLASLVLPTGPVGAVSTTTGPAATGPVPGKPSFIPPPLPARPVAGPNGETRSSIPPLGETRFFQNQVLMQLELNTSDSELNRIAQQLGLRIVTNETLTSLGRRMIRLELPAGLPVREAIRRLEANSLVAVAAPLYRFRLVQGAAAAASRGDPAQYVMGKLHLPQAHAIASGKGITIALIDSAVDKRHSELQGTISDELDTLGLKEGLPSHGTEMAGAIVSRDRLLGVAPGAKIMTVRAFGEANNSAEGTSLSIVKGIDWAVSRGARVINMSFAGPRDPSLERALKSAHDKGVVLIAAAGNAGPKSPPLYPGADPHVIAVTATDARDQQFRGANQGTQLSLAAPGVDILAPAPAETYRMSTGTSIATAHVSGVVALMLERDPTMKPDDVRKILESTATDLGPKGKDKLYGWGLVDPPRALDAVAARLKSSDAVPRSR